MKSKKRGLFLLALLSIVIALVLFGCASSQQVQAPAPTPAPAPVPASSPAPTPTPTATHVATYVGTSTCSSCHDDGEDGKYPATTHAKSFKKLSDFKISNPEKLKNLKVYDALTTDKEVSANLDLATQALGVYMDRFIVVKTPAGFSEKGKFYRAASLKKNGDSYEVVATATPKDKPDNWEAEDATSCVKCHAPGLQAGNQKNNGFSCETCHGPGSEHVAAPANKKIGTINGKAEAGEACLTCHTSNPSKDAKTGQYVTSNHYGTRDYFASTHASSKYQISCLTCHGPHKPNTSGKLVRENNPNDVCLKCHADKKYDVESIMWTNPTDAHDHKSADHSFGAMPYDQLGDDKSTPAIEISNPKMLDLIKSKLETK